MLVSVKGTRRANDTKVDIATIVEDRASTRPPPHQLHVAQPREVHLEPGVLVPAKHNAGRVDVEEEDRRLRMGGLEEAVLQGEIGERVVGAGDVDLRLARGVTGGFFAEWPAECLADMIVWEWEMPAELAAEDARGGHWGLFVFDIDIIPTRNGSTGFVFLSQ